MLRVCRTCLQNIPDLNYISLTDNIQSVQIQNELTLCVPEMVLNSVAQPIICMYCVGALHSAYDFKTRCLQTEECIQKYLQTETLSPEPIDIGDVYVMYDLESNNTNFQLNSNLNNIKCDPSISVDDIKEELQYSDEEIVADDYKTTHECLETIIEFPENHTLVNKPTYIKEDEIVQEKVKKPYQCTNCHYKSAERSKLKRHLLTHNAIKPFKCTLCGFDTRRKDTLTIHMREHSGEKPYQCLYCEFKGVSKYALNMHCMQMHGEKKPHKCPKCKYSALERSTLRRHMAVHSNDKPFKCNQCDFSTAWRYTWTKHMQGHSGLTYKCDICDYSTIYKHNLNLHVVRHSGDKPFKCNKCDYKAAEKSKLKRHVLTHGSVKPFICSICNFGTTRNDTLKKHLMCHKRNQVI